MGDVQAIDIARLGAQGDGIADMPSGAVFVPYALAGERVQADVRGERARLIAVIEASPERIAPVCRHFTHCGGCAVQHLRTPAYLAWKRELVAAAFSARGIDAPIGHVATVGLGAAFLYSHGRCDGFRAYERSVLAFIWLAPWFTRATAEYLLLPLGPPATLLLAWLVLARAGLRASPSRH